MIVIGCDWGDIKCFWSSESLQTFLVLCLLGSKCAKTAMMYFEPFKPIAPAWHEHISSLGAKQIKYEGKFKKCINWRPPIIKMCHSFNGTFTVGIRATSVCRGNFDDLILSIRSFYQSSVSRLLSSHVTTAHQSHNFTSETRLLTFNI